jgi:hypothetical protein
MNGVKRKKLIGCEGKNEKGGKRRGEKRYHMNGFFDSFPKMWNLCSALFATISLKFKYST